MYHSTLKHFKGFGYIDFTEEEAAEKAVGRWCGLRLSKTVWNRRWETWLVVLWTLMFGTSYGAMGQLGMKEGRWAVSRTDGNGVYEHGNGAVVVDTRSDGGWAPSSVCLVVPGDGAVWGVVEATLRRRERFLADQRCRAYVGAPGLRWKAVEEGDEVEMLLTSSMRAVRPTRGRAKTEKQIEQLKGTLADQRGRAALSGLAGRKTSMAEAMRSLRRLVVGLGRGMNETRTRDWARAGKACARRFRYAEKPTAVQVRIAPVVLELARETGSERRLWGEAGSAAPWQRMAVEYFDRRVRSAARNIARARRGAADE